MATFTVAFALSSSASISLLRTIVALLVEKATLISPLARRRNSAGSWAVSETAATYAVSIDVIHSEGFGDLFL